MGTELLKKQFKFMLHHLLNEYELFYELNDRYRKNGRIFRKNVPFRLYEEFRTQSLYRLSKLYNIIGDMQGDSVAYKRLRKIIPQKLNISLSELTQEDREILNSFKDQRNWALHFSKYEYKSEVELSPDYYDEDEIFIIKPKFVTYDVYFNLIHSNWSEINKTLKVIDYAFEDYKILFGKEPSIFINNLPIMDMTSLEKSNISFGYSKSKPKV